MNSSKNLYQTHRSKLIKKKIKQMKTFGLITWQTSTASFASTPSRTLRCRLSLTAAIDSVKNVLMNTLKSVCHHAKSQNAHSKDATKLLPHHHPT